ncbi:MAG: hypothetical protein QNJ62_01445 [Methyloceanibacter sp.]|nr:hypothetical protein [Methyloceanibacter sp.]
MNVFAKTAILTALSAPLLMSGPAAAGGLLSPEELVIRGVANGLTSIARDAERQWDSHYAFKKCLKRYTSRGVPASIANRRCRHFR